MPLDDYRHKRDFSKTPEPSPQVAPQRGSHSFVVQKHVASRLHYDFRLEFDGVLKSWAVPKGPSLDPAEKRLAVQVEDHPLEYADFEGVIPKGQYGGGTVMVWDRGGWEPEPASADIAAALAAGELKFRLAGEKLRGRWMLVRLKPRPGEKSVNWLLFKERDEEARRGDEAAIGESRPLSVISGRSMSEIAAGSPDEGARKAGDEYAGEGSGRGDEAEPRGREGGEMIRPGDLVGAVLAPPPARIELQLATAVKEPPRGEHWLHEVKLDGYRLLARRDREKTTLLTRGGLDWTDRFAEIAAALSALPKTAIVDGEVVAPGADGRPSFSALVDALAADDGRGRQQLIYWVFDLLYADGYDLRGVALSERKRLLRALLDDLPPSGRVRYVDHYLGHGDEVARQACELALEGIVSKRADMPSQGGRSRDWQKYKCRARQEFVVVGFTEGKGAGGLGALLVATREAPQAPLRYAGRVGTGWNEGNGAALRSQLAALTVKRPAFSEAYAELDRRGVTWTQARVVVEVEHAVWDGGTALRHAVFLGRRDDKPAAKVVREGPAEEVVREGAASGDGTLTAGGAAAVAGVAISHPERVIDEVSGLTKVALARYYEAVSERMLPYIAHRPLTLVRCPEGLGAKCFFQRHAAEYFPDEVLRVPTGDGEIVDAAIDSLAGIVTLVQIGVVEFHTWGASLDDLERPDQLVFDLDPDESLPFSRVIEAARLVHDLLAGIGLTSFVKTTGGKGLHVVVPIVPERTWDATKAFTRAVAEALVRFDAKRFTAVASLKERPGRVFVDYLRNRRGATAVCPYSTRRRAGMPVAVPLAWEELDGDLRGDSFSVADALARIAAAASDPWDGFFTVEQRLTTAMEAALGVTAADGDDGS